MNVLGLGRPLIGAESAGVGPVLTAAAATYFQSPPTHPSGSREAPPDRAAARSLTSPTTATVHSCRSRGRGALRTTR